MKTVLLPFQILAALVMLPLILVCVGAVFWAQERVFRNGRDIWGYKRQ